MQYNSLGNNYEGVRLSINNFPKVRTPEIDAMLGTLVKLQGIATEARALIAQKIVIKLKEISNVVE